MAEGAAETASTPLNADDEASGSSVDFLPLESSSSAIWRYFGFPTRDGSILEANKCKHKKVMPKVCLKCFRYYGTLEIP